LCEKCGEGTFVHVQRDGCGIRPKNIDNAFKVDPSEDNIDNTFKDRMHASKRLKSEDLKAEDSNDTKRLKTEECNEFRMQRQTQYQVRPQPQYVLDKKGHIKYTTMMTRVGRFKQVPMVVKPEQERQNEESMIEARREMKRCLKEQLKEQLGCVPVNPSSVKVEPKSEDTKVVTTKPRDRIWK
jgi:hypothetical protein